MTVPWPGPGHWIAASRALRRPVPVDEPYPHVCGATVTGMSGRTVQLRARDCAACAERAQPGPERSGPEWA